MVIGSDSIPSCAVRIANLPVVIAAIYISYRVALLLSHQATFARHKYDE